MTGCRWRRCAGRKAAEGRRHAARLDVEVASPSTDGCADVRRRRQRTLDVLRCGSRRASAKCGPALTLTPEVQSRIRRKRRMLVVGVVEKAISSGLPTAATNSALTTSLPSAVRKGCSGRTCAAAGVASAGHKRASRRPQTHARVSTAAFSKKKPGTRHYSRPERTLLRPRARPSLAWYADHVYNSSVAWRY